MSPSSAMTPRSIKATRTSPAANSSAAATQPDVTEVDPLQSTSDAERTSLAIKFGQIRMCAALTHGHSFESSIFKLPGKCSACHEMVWGPFTRGCTCLTCKLTAHRACIGAKGMPPCPTKSSFQNFCRSELDRQHSENKMEQTKEPQLYPTPATTRFGDLDEWAKVEGSSIAERSRRAISGASSLSPRKTQPQQPIIVSPSSSPLREVRDHYSFSWSPFGIMSDRKRLHPPHAKPPSERHKPPTRAITGKREEQRGESESVSLVTSTGRDQQTPSSRMLVVKKEGGARGGVSSAVGPGSEGNGGTGVLGLTSFGKISVAGGVVGAVLGGPAGAVAGLKLGVVVAAGRWSVQEGLWQRIKQERKEAGAETIAMLNEKTVGESSSAGESTQDGVKGCKTPDIWALIAERVERNEKLPERELNNEQQECLERGESDVQEVAAFIVEQILGDETAPPYCLYRALLAEFRSRHTLCDCGRVTEPSLCQCVKPKTRRPRDTDMVSLFPRTSGMRQSSQAGASEENSESVERSNDSTGTNNDQNDGTQFFARMPGLEKTFSFVEETEIVAGEGSDTVGGEDSYSRTDEDDFDDESVMPSERGSESAVSLVPAWAPKRALANISHKELGKSNALHLDNWVELEGIGCNSCGGRIVNRQSNGRSTSVPAADIEEDEEACGESWAAAEGPPCWCADDAGLSASPESMQSTLHGPRRDMGGEDEDRRGLEDRQNLGTEDRAPERDEGFEQVPRGEERSVEEALSESDPIDAPNEQHNQPKGDGRRVHETISGDEHGGGNKGGEEQVEAAASEGKPEPCDALRDVHGLLRELSRAVLACCPALTMSQEAAIHAVNCIDRRVFAETYVPVYGRIAAGQACERDEALTRRVRQDARSRASEGRPALATYCRPHVLATLRSTRTARTGRDKLDFLVQAVEDISEALPPRSTTDTLLWSLCRHLAAATLATGVEVTGMDPNPTTPALARPHAEIVFVEQFTRNESWLMGKEGYVLTTVDAALHVLLDPATSDEVFVDVNPEGGSGAPNS